MPLVDWEYERAAFMARLRFYHRQQLASKYNFHLRNTVRKSSDSVKVV